MSTMHGQQHLFWMLKGALENNRIFMRQSHLNQRHEWYMWIALAQKLQD